MFKYNRHMTADTRACDNVPHVVGAVTAPGVVCMGPAQVTGHSKYSIEFYNRCLVLACYRDAVSL